MSGARFRSLVREHGELLLIFSIGVLLRIGYVARTGIGMRMHDASSHMEYITYVLQHWQVPHAQLGWEMHQPPLYYILAALAGKANVLLTGGTPPWQGIQLLSFFLSIVTAAIGCVIAATLFPAKREEDERLLLAALLCVFPGLIFPASQISNDALTFPWIFAFAALLLRWWKSGKERDWFWCSLIAGASLLVKLTAALMLPVLLLCIAAKGGISRTRTWMMAAAATAFSAGISAWFILLRWSESYYDKLLHPGTGPTMDARLLLPRSVVDFLIFSPPRILLLPFANPWADESGRRFFWEYLFRSAFFGEWRNPSYVFFAQVLLIMGLGMLGLAIVGCIRMIRERRPVVVPLLALFIIPLASLMTIRMAHPCVCLQDFRFIPSIAISLSVFAVMSLQDANPRWRPWIKGWIAGFAVLCAAFVLALSYAG